MTDELGIFKQSPDFKPDVILRDLKGELDRAPGRLRDGGAVETLQALGFGEPSRRSRWLEKNSSASAKRTAIKKIQNLCG